MAARILGAWCCGGAKRSCETLLKQAPLSSVGFPKQSMPLSSSLHLLFSLSGTRRQSRFSSSPAQWPHRHVTICPRFPAASSFWHSDSKRGYARSRGSRLRSEDSDLDSPQERIKIYRTSPPNPAISILQNSTDQDTLEVLKPSLETSDEGKVYKYIEKPSLATVDNLSKFEDFGKFDIRFHRCFSPPPPLMRTTAQLSVFEMATFLLRCHAEDIYVIEAEEHSRILADYLVVCSGSSPRHISAIGDSLRDLIIEGIEKKNGTTKNLIFDYESDHWLAVSTGNIVVHIFSYEARAHYDLEELWTVEHFEAAKKEKNPPSDPLRSNEDVSRHSRPPREEEEDRVR